MIKIKKATQKDIQGLSKLLLALLENKNSQLYQDNVSKFGIPEDYVNNAFARETMLKAAATGKTTFYLALDGNEIAGFAQVTLQDGCIAELDRIIVFPQYARQGVGTQLLHEAIADHKQKGAKTLIVNAGKEEAHARRFYEKNVFKQINEKLIDTPWGKKLTLVTYQLHINQ
ncbi:MAG: GNAT family N-acetyltransferase [Candidatus Bathyarchaeota archaeon]|nr:GNAT family N-acetyltransferase [Candidatus Bathyarchaeota archaeon]